MASEKTTFELDLNATSPELLDLFKTLSTMLSEAKTRSAAAPGELAAQREAADTASAAAFTALAGMQPPTMPGMPVPEARDPRSAAMLTLLGGLSSTASGDPQARQAIRDQLETERRERNTAVRENTIMKREEMLQSYQQDMQMQLLRYRALQERADEIGDLELSTKYGKDIDRIFGVLEKLVPVTLGLADARNSIYQSYIKQLDDLTVTYPSFEAYHRAIMDIQTRILGDKNITKEYKFAAIAHEVASQRFQGQTVDHWVSTLQKMGETYKVKEDVVMRLIERYGRTTFPGGPEDPNSFEAWRSMIGAPPPEGEPKPKPKGLPPPEPNVSVEGGGIQYTGPLAGAATGMISGIAKKAPAVKKALDEGAAEEWLKRTPGGIVMLPAELIRMLIEALADRKPKKAAADSTKRK